MIHWLIQTSDDMPETDDWLREEERARLASIKTPKRRADWLVGRWTAKELARRVLPSPLEPQDIGIHSRRDGTTQVYVGGIPRFRVSISHSHGRAFCALVEGGLLGADIERIERHTSQFTEDYFTEAEREIVGSAAEADFLTTAIWSAKEAALKALRLGLTVDTRAVTCRVRQSPAQGWMPFEVECDASRLMRCADLIGWWRIVCLDGEGFVLTLAAERQGQEQHAGAKHDERYGVLH
jgi:4'-phosphopantetheinyl transferase